MALSISFCNSVINYPSCVRRMAAFVFTVFPWFVSAQNQNLHSDVLQLNIAPFHIVGDIKEKIALLHFGLHILSNPEELNFCLNYSKLHCHISAPH